MGLKNTAASYGSIAKWIHWITAALFLASYVSVYYRHWFTEEKTPENWNALQIHLVCGGDHRGCGGYCGLFGG